MKEAMLMTSGAIMLGMIGIALFFLRFWRSTGDRLFAMFAAAFALLGLERMLLHFLGTSEFRPGVYLVRLVAFVLIILAIVEKNRKR